MIFKNVKYDCTWLSTVAVFLVNLICIDVSLCQTTAGKEFKTNCFKETDSGRCEDSWIKICSNYYSCDMVIELEAPPKRLGYANDNILVAIGSQTYIVHNETLKPMTARRFIPPWDEFVDKAENRYYTGEGTTYMTESKTKKEIEILTSGEYSVNQLAFDKETNQLLILSFSTHPETNERSGSLFAINTATIDATNDKVQAEKVDGAGNSITAMAVEGDLEKLLLGTRTSQGGKVVRLTRQKGNPCSESTSGKAAMLEVIKEAQEKLLKIFDEVSITPSHMSVLSSTAAVKTPRSIEIENIRLKRNLDMTTAKLNSLTSRLLNFNTRLRSVQYNSNGVYLHGHSDNLERAPNTNLLYPEAPEQQWPTAKLSGPSGPPRQAVLPEGEKKRNSQPAYGPGIVKSSHTISSQTLEMKLVRDEDDTREREYRECVDMYNVVSRRATYAENANTDLKRQLDELTLNVDSILMDSNRPTDSELDEL